MTNDENTSKYIYMYGEGGISVHVTENNEEMLIGAPGVMNWKGTVIIYRPVEGIDGGGISKRDTISHKISKRIFRSEVLDPDASIQDENSYFGYAVSSGQFSGPNKKKILYVASAPRANLQQGEVSGISFYFSSYIVMHNTISS